MKRPLSVTLIACLFIIAGSVGFVYHLHTDRPLNHWVIIIFAVRLFAVVGGAFLLLGQNWARWLLLAWLAFHVCGSALHSYSEALAHLALLILLGYILLRPPASNYFQQIGVGTD
jgi:hypothetical protein